MMIDNSIATLDSARSPRDLDSRLLGGDTISTATMSVEESGVPQGWSDVIDILLQWLSKPEALADDDIEAPSSDSIRKAIDAARRLQAAGGIVPDHVIPSGAGGLVFELERAPRFWVIEIDRKGSIELRVLNESKLESREALTLSASAP